MSDSNYSLDENVDRSPMGPITVEETIVKYLRQGAFAHVAAAAAGVPRRVFEEWLARGQTGRPEDERYRLFHDKAMQALALARLVAEAHIHRASPKDWLRFGPGKEQPAGPGWGTKVEAIVHQIAGTSTPTDAQWKKMWGILLAVLDAFPEAQQAVQQAITVGLQVEEAQIVANAVG